MTLALVELELRQIEVALQDRIIDLTMQGGEQEAIDTCLIALNHIERHLGCGAVSTRESIISARMQAWGR